MEFKYFCNEEKGLVIAVYEADCASELLGKDAHLIDELSWCASGRRKRNGTLSYYLSQPVKITARATCLPEDTYDEKIGKKIATIKLMAKINKRRASLCLVAVNFLDEITSRYGMEWHKYNDLHNKYIDTYEEMIDGMIYEE